jgi:hypothetical protein
MDKHCNGCGKGISVFGNRKTKKDGHKISEESMDELVDKIETGLPFIAIPMALFLIIKALIVACTQ